MVRRITEFVLVLSLFATVLVGQTQGTDAPKADAGKQAKPAGDWVNWDEVQKQFSDEAIKKITDPDAKAAVQKIKDENIDTRTNALADFKKGAGLGISIAVGNRGNSIDDAAVINNKVVVTSRPKDHPRAALEIHQLFTTNVFSSDGRRAAVEQLKACGVEPVNCPMVGIGPFAALQTGDNDAINSVGFGVMLGLRTDPRQTSSFNLGLGIAFDSHIKQLANGFTEGQAPPDNATEVKFTEKSTRRFLITLSFAF
jgi:hypothetical protein